MVKHKSGDLLGVFQHNAIGDIDLVWGDDNGGLKHIIRRHIKEQKDFRTIDELQYVVNQVIKNGTIVRENTDKINIEYNGYKVSIRKTIRDEEGNITQNKNWIVTAFDRTKPQREKINTSSSETLSTPLANQTADGVTLPSNEVSYDKDTTNSVNSNEVGKNIAEVEPATTPTKEQDKSGVSKKETVASANDAVETVKNAQKQEGEIEKAGIYSEDIDGNTAYLLSDFKKGDAGYWDSASKYLEVNPGVGHAIIPDKEIAFASENNAQSFLDWKARQNDKAELREGIRHFAKNHGRDVRFREAPTKEEQGIIGEAKAMGTYMKSPNGEPTRLDERQWVQARTKSFKEWFGDWEKPARIEKLRNSKPVEITGQEYNGKYKLNRDSAKSYIKGSLRKEYRIKDTGETVSLTNIGANKVTSHSMGDNAHLKSIAVIPELISDAIFIEERPCEKANGKYDSYRYYVCGFKIGDVDYTVKLLFK